jgi:CRP-like cAMP-binding protein
MPDTIDLEGSLSFLGVADLLQLMGSNANTGVLRLKTSDIPDEGQIFIHSGNPVDARLGEKTGLDAIFPFFGWMSGRFTFTQKNVDPENRLKHGRMQIILDALRMLDDGEIPKISQPPAETPAVKTEEPPHEKKSVPERNDIHVIKGPFIDYMYVIDEELYEDGQEFVIQGSYGSWIWVILDGTVEIVRKTDQGDIPVLRLGQGTFIGNFSSFIQEKRPRSASVIARGKVQLGIIVNQRLSADFARLSHGFREIIASLEKRLKMVTDTYIKMITGTYAPPHKDGIFTPLIKTGDSSPGLWRIDNGEALVVKKDGKKNFLACELGIGDFIGCLPFLNIEMEPFSAAVFASQNLQKTELDADLLHSEYRSLSDTMKNMLGTMAECIALTGNLITNPSAKKVDRQMGGIEKRIHKSRIDSKNLVAYSCMDDSGSVIKQGMGRTLNVSEGGILLEIHKPFEAGTILFLSIGFEEEVCDISAKVVYIQNGDDGMYKCGMSFQDVDEKMAAFLKNFIDFFMSRPEMF